MTRNHALLDSLGVTTDGLDRLVDLSTDAGALGAKMTGGGGGGAVIALGRGQAQASAIAEAGAGVAHRTFTVRIARSEETP